MDYATFAQVLAALFIADAVALQPAARRIGDRVRQQKGRTPLRLKLDLRSGQRTLHPTEPRFFYGWFKGLGWEFGIGEAACLFGLSGFAPHFYLRWIGPILVIPVTALMLIQSTNVFLGQARAELWGGGGPPKPRSHRQDPDQVLARDAESVEPVADLER